MDRRLFVLTLGMFAIGTDSFVVAAILPSVSQSLNTTISLAGQMVTVYALSFGIFAPVVAALAAAWSRKFLLVAAMFVFVVGNAITAIAPDLNAVLASRVIAGLGAAMFAPTALAAAASLVPPERRGRALSTVTAGLAGATALGSPTGALISSFVGWRGTLWFVSSIGVIAGIGIWAKFRAIPQPPRITLLDRIAPVRDPRIALTLLTTLFAFGGLLMVYTYIGATFDRVTSSEPNVLAAMLFVWGVSAVAGNLLSGQLVDRFGSRRVINGVLIVTSLNFAVLPWTSAHFLTALPALIIWGSCGWGLLVPQQHRLVTIAPAIAPLSLALNNTATYIGVASASIVGGTVIAFLDVRDLGFVGAGSIAFALILAETAFALINGHRHK
jgi:MFS transporter, DHA1 family, inner membrane transport protein